MQTITKRKVAKRKIAKKKARSPTPAYLSPKEFVAEYKVTPADRQVITASKMRRAKKAKGSRAPISLFMKPMRVSPQLGAIIGAGSMPRTEITKKLWGYIKKNGLQDVENKRMINTDQKLRGLFNGKRRVSLFELVKVVSMHLK